MIEIVVIFFSKCFMKVKLKPICGYLLIIPISRKKLVNCNSDNKNHDIGVNYYSVYSESIDQLSILVSICKEYQSNNISIPRFEI